MTSPAAIVAQRQRRVRKSEELRRRLARVLIQSQPGDPLPPLWHWLYFLPLARQSDIGPDGHPKRGGFLPPGPLPRRMWAGGRLTFHKPIGLEEKITRVSTVADVTVKQGRAGALCFVLKEDGSFTRPNDGICDSEAVFAEWQQNGWIANGKHLETHAVPAAAPPAQ